LALELITESTWKGLAFGAAPCPRMMMHILKVPYRPRVVDDEKGDAAAAPIIAEGLKL